MNIQGNENIMMVAISISQIGYIEIIKQNIPLETTCVFSHPSYRHGESAKGGTRMTGYVGSGNRDKRLAQPVHQMSPYWGVCSQQLDKE